MNPKTKAILCTYWRNWSFWNSHLGYSNQRRSRGWIFIFWPHFFLNLENVRLTYGKRFQSYDFMLFFLYRVFCPLHPAKRILQNRLSIQQSFPPCAISVKVLKARVPAIDVNSYGIWTFGSNVGIYKNLSYTPSFHLEITFIIIKVKSLELSYLIGHTFLPPYSTEFNWIFMPESSLVVLLCNSNKPDMCRLSNHPPFNVNL